MDEVKYLGEANIFPFELHKEVFYDDGNISMVLELGESCFIHLHYNDMNKAVYKKVIEVWEDAREYLNSIGCPIVFCIIPNVMPLRYKVEKMFGFELLEQNDTISLFVAHTGE